MQVAHRWPNGAINSTTATLKRLSYYLAADSITVAANAGIDFGSLIYGRQNYTARGWLSYDAEGVADRSFPAPRDAYLSEKLRSILMRSVADRLIDKQNGRARFLPSRHWVLRFPIRRRFGWSLNLPLRHGRACIKTIWYWDRRDVPQEPGVGAKLRPRIEVRVNTKHPDGMPDRLIPHG